jgi:hypothetical protein
MLNVIMLSAANKLLMLSVVMLNVLASETTLELTLRFVNYCCKKFHKIAPGPEVNLPRHHNSKPDSAGVRS